MGVSRGSAGRRRSVDRCFGSNGAAGCPRIIARQFRSPQAKPTSRFVPIGIGKSVVIDLPRDVKDVLVADPKIANAVVRTSRRAYVIGVTVGQTSVVFFDADGRQIAGLDIAVTRDLNGVRAALRHIFPDGDIRIDGVGDGVVLTGTVANPGESQQAFDIAARLVGDIDKVVNGITIRGRDQVCSRSRWPKFNATSSSSSGSILAAARDRHVGGQLQHRQSIQREWARRSPAPPSGRTSPPTLAAYRRPFARWSAPV